MNDQLGQMVTQALRNVLDPETGRDIVAMGLIYDVEVRDDTARVIMTTTTRGCPLSEFLREGAEAAIASVPGIRAVEVRLTWDPPWSPDRIEPLVN